MRVPTPVHFCALFSSSGVRRRKSNTRPNEKIILHSTREDMGGRGERKKRNKACLEVENESHNTPSIIILIIIILS